MASRRIIWSPKSKERLYQILEFFNHRNRNTIYSKKLYKSFRHELSTLKKQPYIGVKTNFENVHGLIVGDYVLFYEIELTQINVITVWDSRQDPENLKII
ncbi:type II toxin-antitoxin system RelE/ParE family toxin [Flavobacterium sp. GT2N3]|uniref:type II toxin-antitoxin system RelE/ParE family toxin n=1 Tax=unclassified Flavobacterium TaxID=196869 RepID=UPI003AACEA24